MLDRIKTILGSRPFELGITGLIVLNAITLALETWPAAESPVLVACSILLTGPFSWSLWWK